MVWLVSIPNIHHFDHDFIFCRAAYIQMGLMSPLPDPLFSKRGQDFNSAPIFISSYIADIRVYSCPGVQGTDYLFPLFLYPDTNKQQTLIETAERTPNLDKEIVSQMAEKLGLRFTNEKETDPGTFAPIDILDYIYAVLHSPTYRDKYKEFLKIDFPGCLTQKMSKLSGNWWHWTANYG